MDTLGRICVCRLCAMEKGSYLRIYDDEGYKLSLEIKISKYLQIQVDEKDSLPKSICCECYSKLEEYSNFVNNSQNNQIALLKIFPIYEDSSLKEENLYSHDAIFHAQSNLLSFNAAVLDKVDQSEAAFECNDLNLTASNTDCFFDASKQADCLFDDDRSKIIQNNATTEECSNNLNQVQCNDISNDCSNINSADCNMFNLRKKFNKRKCITPVRYFTNNAATARTKRKLCRKKKLGATKKKKLEPGAIKQDQEDCSENESEILKEKYFNHLPWICSGCNTNFPTLNELQDHYSNYHLQSPRYICPYCYKVYMQYQGFVSHIKQQKCDDEASCDQCGKVFSSRRMLESHLLLHTDKRPYECNHCGKSFRQQSALYVHSKCHLPEHMKVEYSCDQCDKSFSTKPNLITHKKIHTGVRNYVCDLCGKSFVQKGNLCAHKLTHSNNKPFTCEICNKEFKTLMQLRKHSNVHTGKKPHQCDTCGRTFRERGTLKEHYRIHTGAMPFSCEFCGKAFRFKGVLTTHRRQHTGEKPYSCVECQHHFTNWPNYNKHMKRRHGINTSKATRIKLDDQPQNAPLSQETINGNADTIDIASFEDSLQPVPAIGDKTVDLFDTTSTTDGMASTYLLSHQNYADTTQQHQNSILNAYYNMTTLQSINQASEVVDLMNANMYRDYV